jgi:hypothetical protein
MDLDWGDFTALEADQMIIWRSALVGLEEQVEHLIHRSRYYDEYPKTEDAFIEAMEDLASRIKQIQRTNQGEG